jgi:hypothetical protein
MRPKRLKGYHCVPRAGCSLERGVTQNKINGFIGNSTHYMQAIITVQRCHIEKPI